MIRLFRDNIVVRMDESEKTSEGGIFLPDGRTAVDGGLIGGTVLQVGPGIVTRKGVRVPIELEVGDRVVFCRFIGKVESKMQMQHLMDSEYGPRALMLEVKDIVCVETRDETEPSDRCSAPSLGETVCNPE